MAMLFRDRQGLVDHNISIDGELGGTISRNRFLIICGSTATAFPMDSNNVIPPSLSQTKRQLPKVLIIIGKLFPRIGFLL